MKVYSNSNSLLCQQLESKPASGHQSQLLTAHPEQEMSECPPLTSTRLCPSQHGSVHRLLAGPCLPEMGERGTADLSPCESPPHCHRGHQSCSLAGLVSVKSTFPSWRKGKGGKESQSCWEAEQRVNTRSKQGPRQSVDCHRTKGKEWHCQPLRHLLTTDLGMSVRFVAF